VWTLQAFAQASFSMVVFFLFLFSDKYLVKLNSLFFFFPYTMVFVSNPPSFFLLPSFFCFALASWLFFFFFSFVGDFFLFFFFFFFFLFLWYFFFLFFFCFLFFL